MVFASILSSLNKKTKITTNQVTESETQITSISLLGSIISGTSDNQQIGTSVALNYNGDRVLVGSASTDCKVYEYSGGSWQQLNNNLLNTTGYGSFKSESAIDYSGNIAAVSNYNSGSGIIKIFEHSSNSWTQKGNNITGDSGEKLGTFICINSNGTRIAMSSSYGSVDIAKVYEFNTNTNDWVQLGSDIPSSSGFSTSENTCENIGFNADGDRLIVGARTNKVYIFDYDSTNGWVQSNVTFTSGVVSKTVSLNQSGDKFVYGDKSNKKVKIYQNSNGSWVQLGSTISGTDNNFGEEVRISDNILIIGIDHALGSGKSYPGKTLVYYFNNDWNLIDTIYGDNSRDHLPSGISLSGNSNRFAVSAGLGDALYANSGYIKVYDLI